MSLITKIYREVCQKHGADINSKKVNKFLAFEMIEKALMEKTPYISREAIPYQQCPVCSATGKIVDGGLNPKTGIYKAEKICDTCGGTKVVPMYMPPKPKVCRLFVCSNTSGLCDNCGEPQHNHE